MDGKSWIILVDRENSFRDVPNDYVQLSEPKKVRYIRYHNIHVPMANLAISDLRVFGKGSGKMPLPVKNVRVQRSKDRREVTLQWKSQSNCQGYVVRWGILPNKCYSSWTVYDKNTHLLKCLSVDQDYYFSVIAFNENGISKASDIVKPKAQEWKKLSSNRTSISFPTTLILWTNNLQSFSNLNYFNPVKQLLFDQFVHKLHILTNILKV